MGLTLVERDLLSIQLEGPNGHRLKYEILQLFPFTSESKRMGIILRVSYMYVYEYMYVYTCSADENFKTEFYKYPKMGLTGAKKDLFSYC